VDEATQRSLTPQIERRKYRRARLATQVRCEAQRRDDILLTRDVSVGGLFLHATNPLQPTTDVVLTFHLESDQPAISCRGQVVSSIAGLGMGVQFLDMSDPARAALEKFVDEST
jgi:c-di-GMP-binding flagellar brake protein YcgR